jgi:hypothetical protein
MKRLRPSPAMVVAVVALFSSLGGSAFAALVITGHNIKNSSVTGVDIRNGALASRDIKRNSVGGAAILESKLGPVPSSEGVLHQAVVGANGALARGRGVSSATRTGPGRYQVIFDRDVRSCAYFGTVADPGAANPPQGQITLSGLASNVNGVDVRTETSDGGASNKPFHLQVSC